MWDASRLPSAFPGNVSKFTVRTRLSSVEALEASGYLTAEMWTPGPIFKPSSLSNRLHPGLMGERS